MRMSIKKNNLVFSIQVYTEFHKTEKCEKYFNSPCICNQPSLPTSSVVLLIQARHQHTSRRPHMAHLHARATALRRCSGTRAAVTLGDDLAYPLQECKCTFWHGCVLQFLQACDLPGACCRSSTWGMTALLWGAQLVHLCSVHRVLLRHTYRELFRCLLHNASL